jgi:uncharacterized protein YgiM (DUF1202 family)
MKQHLRPRYVTILILVLSLMILGTLPAFAQQPQFQSPIVVVNTSFLNVRTGPGAQYTVLATVVGGSEFPVLGVGSDGVWYLVSTPVGIGWVNVEFTLPRGNFSVVPEINVNTISAVLLAAPESPTIALQGEGQGGGGSAFAASSTVERFRAAINVEFVNLRQAPADNAPALTILTPVSDRLTDFALVGRAMDDRHVEWVAIDVPNFGVGWVEAPKVITRLSARYATVMVMTATEFGLTSGPAGGSGAGLPILQQNEEVFLIGNSGDTYAQVETADGRTGWIPFSVLRFRQSTTSDVLRAQGDTREALAVADQGGGAPSIVFPTLATPRLIVNTSFLNVRSGPGGEFSVVATLSGGDEVQALGISRDGFWFLARGTFGTGWVDTDFVLFRGNIDSIPVIDPGAALEQATVQAPVVIFSTSLTLYAAPGVNFGAVGFVNGPGELPVVARTADGLWVQISTPNGFGWVLADQVVVRGDPNLIPVVG